jgi:DNA-binding response OmpR family regulator
MRLLLLTEANHFSDKIKQVSGPDNPVTVFTSDDAFVKAAAASNFDCAICDEKWLSSLKGHFQNPIFVISSTQSSTWTRSLQAGADGVLFDDLPVQGTLAQVAAFLRRWSKSSLTKRFLPRFGMLIDLERYRVELKEKVLDLTLTELKVLKELANDDEHVVPRMAIQNEVFGQLSPGNRSLDVHVCSLRKKLRPHGVDVESVRGVGYRLLPYVMRPVKAVAESAN